VKATFFERALSLSVRKNSIWQAEKKIKEKFCFDVSTSPVKKSGVMFFEASQRTVKPKMSVSRVFQSYQIMTWGSMLRKHSAAEQTISNVLFFPYDHLFFSIKHKDNAFQVVTTALQCINT
jgi:hypothetical protein